MKDKRLLTLEINYNLGVAYYQKASYWAYDEAEKAFEEVVKTVGEIPESEHETELLALAHCGLAAIAAQRSTDSRRDDQKEELWEAGQEHYRRAKELVSEDSDTFLQAQYVLALLLFFNRQDFVAARETIGEVLARNPYHWRAHTVLGQIAMTEGHITEAIDGLKRAVALVPDFEYAHYQLGHAYSKLGKTDLAIEAYKKAPSIGGAIIGLGRELGLRKKDYAGAIEQFERALELNTGYAEAHADLAWYLVEGDLIADEDARNRAVSAAEEAVRLTKEEDWRKLGTLGRTYYTCGRIEDAQKVLQNLMEMKPDAPHALFYLAQIAFDRQEYEEARAYLIPIFSEKGDEMADYWRDKAKKLMAQINRELS